MIRIPLENAPRDSEPLGISIVTLLGLVSSVVVAVGWFV